MHVLGNRPTASKGGKSNDSTIGMLPREETEKVSFLWLSRFLHAQGDIKCHHIRLLHTSIARSLLFWNQTLSLYLDSPSSASVLKKAAASARTMTTLHEDANVEEAEEVSLVPEDKCQQQLKLLDKGHNHVKEGHQQMSEQPTMLVRNQFIIDTD